MPYKSIINIILEDFIGDLDNIVELLAVVEAKRAKASVRVTSANSLTLLLAARFEEFIRQLARCLAEYVVVNATEPRNIPKKLFDTLWRRTFDGLARRKLSGHNAGSVRVSEISQAEISTQRLFKFLNGDHSQSVFDDLIHNDNNMRPQELNSMFSISDFSNACMELSKNQKMQDYFGSSNAEECNGRVISDLDGFMIRRNDIAHSLNPNSSASESQVFEDIVFFSCLSECLASALILRMTPTPPPHHPATLSPHP